MVLARSQSRSRLSAIGKARDDQREVTAVAERPVDLVICCHNPISMALATVTDCCYSSLDCYMRRRFNT
jgi:hypothetical protein